MGDLISRSRLKEELKSWAVIIQKPRYYSREDADFVIDAQAAVDAVEVVRCKDCKWYKEGRILKENKFCFRLKHPKEDRRIGYNFSPDDFCSYGERKEK